MAVASLIYETMSNILDICRLTDTPIGDVCNELKDMATEFAETTEMVLPKGDEHA